MLIQELRIGNLVKSVLTDETYIIDIWALRTIEDGNYQKGHNTSKKVFKPIPLTEEWLLKFGFKKDLGNDLYLDSTSTSFFIWQNNRVELLDDKNNICISHCEYVHQLQNLYFALTGQELIIK